MIQLQNYAKEVASRARVAASALSQATGRQKADWLQRAADRLIERGSDILAANERDVAAAPDYGLTAAATDRLRLDERRLESIAAGLVEVSQLPDPVGEMIESQIRPNGLRVSRVRVPLGVVFFIYESRPNVTVDAAALCVKSGNAVILRGGKEAFHSNTAFHDVLCESLRLASLPEDSVQLVETLDRAVVGEFLALGDLIDVTIPRGGKSLIERVSREARMPVIKHFDGICHVYVDSAADPQMAEQIAINSKCQRPGVCNAAETLLVHSDHVATLLPEICKSLRERDVELRGCSRVCDVIPEAKPATDADFGTEYLELILSVKVVDSLEEAIAHINEYGSHHTDAIVSNDVRAVDQFTAQVDSSAVMVNASTRFNDGFEFGLGAEIGISTDRFHARGPCGLRELTTYKYIAQGDGQLKE